VRWRAVAAARREKQTEQVTLCPPFDTPNSRRLCASEPFGDGPILWMGVAKAASRLGCRRLPSTTASRSLVPAVRSWRARWPYGTSIDASAEKFPRGVTRKKQSLRPSGAGCEIRGTRVDGTGKGTSLHLIRATWTRRPGRGFPARGSSRTLHRPVRGEAMEEPSMDALGASMVPQWSPSQPLGLRLSSSPGSRRAGQIGRNLPESVNTNPNSKSHDKSKGQQEKANPAARLGCTVFVGILHAFRVRGRRRCPRILGWRWSADWRGGQGTNSKQERERKYGVTTQ